MPPSTVCVIGSANLDLSAYPDRLPAPGETVHARRFTTGFGGKGANQAVTAARLGSAVTFVARVGADSFGRDMLAHFRAEAIDTRFVTPTPDAPTGTALITVDAAGRNTIVVAPGANGHLSASDVEAARSAIESAGVLVCQQEVPADANLAAMRIAARAGVPVVFNPAPAATPPLEAYQLTTVLCPNEHEAAVLSGRDVHTPEDAEAAARELQTRGSQAVVVTLGERGCLVLAKGEVALLPAPSVLAVDTTGAGDAFVGSLAVFLARGVDLVTAARRAIIVAATSVQFPGAQTSFPRAADLPADLFGDPPA
jgi:ribokinase